jgi:GntR family transcriptional regulator, transcriptional repressor for pyruvate dehydrogenase complex
MIAPSADMVVRTMSEEILSSTLAPGDKLPSERELANRFRVGRPLIREALRSLSELGLIETIPARGTFVRAGHDTRADRQAGMAIRRRGVTAEELSEARLMLETATARLAAVRATAPDIERLETTLGILEQSVGVEHVERDLTFHLDIATAAHNPVVEMMLESIAVPTAALMFRSVGDPAVMQRSQPFHRICLDAIRARDPDAAGEAIRAHLTVAQELYGVDYERSVDELALQALDRLGAQTGLDDLVDRVLSARRAGRFG